ncbi:ABC transporter substrate-binding protein [Paenibacillus sp. J5C_2022]|uniref:ABC transporter substrate-binding protein n=1 Tax=Paenibacillus sp. J5C2022 TaxID=2977129 RepID=UPI0021D01B30|nr:ABC transporter substrate-binding protein [Paenibacillus sp. J5C2022]MCU6712857.1 ABC transporter substrate-binding protein [Paenibacillus sp. J5C2022]
MKNRSGLNMMLVIALFMLLVGCGQGNAGSGSNSDPSASPAETEAASNKGNETDKVEKAIEIKFMHVFGGAQGEAIQELVDRYNASQSKVVVTAEQAQGFYDGLLEKLQTLAVSKQLPEVAIGSYANGEFMSTRMPIRPMHTFIDKEAYSTEDYTAQMLKLGQDAEGKQQSLPFLVSTPLIYVNLDHFEQAGIPVVEQPESWEQVRGWAKQLADAAPDRGGVYFQMDFDTWMFQTLLETKGGSYASVKDKDVQFNDEAGKEVLRYWLEMRNEDKSIPMMNGTQAAEAFQSGNLSMLVATTGNLANLAKNSSFKLGIMLLPTWEGNETSRRLPAGGAGLYVFQSNEEKEAAAWDFVKFATSPEGSALLAQKMGYMTVRDSARNELMADYLKENPMAAATYKQAQDIVPWFNWPGDAGTRATRTLLDHIQGSFSGDMTGDEALDKAAVEIEKILRW